MAETPEPLGSDVSLYGLACRLYPLLVVSHTAFSVSFLAWSWALGLGGVRRYSLILERGGNIVVLGFLALFLTGAALCLGGGMLGKRVPSATINCWCIATMLGVVLSMLIPAIAVP